MGGIDQMKEDPQIDESLWEKADYDEVFNQFVEKGLAAHTGAGDYEFRAHKLGHTLGLDPRIKADKKYTELNSEFGKMHYLSTRRAREVIMESVIPLLKKLPTIEGGSGMNAKITSGAAGIKSDPRLEAVDVSRAIESLMWAALCATQNKGSKLLSSGEEDLRGGPNMMIEAIHDEEARSQDRRFTIENIRGDELERMLRQSLKMDAAELALIAKRHGGQELAAAFGWLDSHK